MNDTEVQTTQAAISPENQGIIDQLVALQAATLVNRKPISDGAFARRLRIGSSSRWSLIRSGKYFKGMIQNLDAVFLELGRALSAYQARSMTAVRFEGKQFIENDNVRAIFSAVDDCTAKTLSDRQRIIFYLAPTGGGKSFLAFELWRRNGAVVVNANKGWRQRGNNALRDIWMKLEGF